MSALTIFLWIIFSCLRIVAIAIAITFAVATIKEIKRYLTPTDKED